MADVTDSFKPSTTAGPYPAVMLKKTINTATSTQADEATLNLFDVYPGDFVLNVSAQVVTAEGGTLTFDVGDGADVDGYIDGANGNSAGWNTNLHLMTATASTGATPTVTVSKTGFTGGKIYTTTDTIDVLWKDAANLAKVTFRAVIIRG